jgi:hypothetical protein
VRQRGRSISGQSRRLAPLRATSDLPDRQRSPDRAGWSVWCHDRDMQSGGVRSRQVLRIYLPTFDTLLRVRHRTEPVIGPDPPADPSGRNERIFSWLLDCFVARAPRNDGVRFRAQPLPVIASEAKQSSATLEDLLFTGRLAVYWKTCCFKAVFFTAGSVGIPIFQGSATQCSTELVCPQ